MTESRTPHPPINDVSKVDDHQWPLKRAARNGAIAVSLIILASLVAWGAVADLEGLWGAILGGAIGGGFMLATVIVILATSNTSPTTTMAVVLGSWLLKAAVVLVIMLLLKDMDFYHRGALATTIILTLIAALGTETYAVTKGQRLYVG
ncbi:MAG TPA: hypothetical protein H9867_09720 [Candidatus Corynebacterium gallistercoris]|uniref:Integral membrane protein n=1 Tax=Candidatus Corynebacterium gallistercoris TaxID=2838530 RepID=A0A9D1URW4_9CORY|nr:hypothetical protein [Candidatus Corynebacterium gallistercoris]